MSTIVKIEDYGHPGSHPADIVTQDENNRFVTDTQITNWDVAADAIHTTGSRPLPSEAVRSMIWVTRGALGIADFVSICLKGADDIYTWVDIA